MGSPLLPAPHCLLLRSTAHLLHGLLPRHNTNLPKHKYRGGGALLSKLTHRGHLRHRLFSQATPPPSTVHTHAQRCIHSILSAQRAIVHIAQGNPRKKGFVCFCFQISLLFNRGRLLFGPLKGRLKIQQPLVLSQICIYLYKKAYWTRCAGGWLYTCYILITIRSKITKYKNAQDLFFKKR